MRHTLRVLDRSGDTAVQWAPENQTETETAKQVFDRFAAAGYAMFRAEPGTTATQIREFDPEAKEIVATRPFVGG